MNNHSPTPAEGLALINDTASEPARILAGFLAEHSREFYNGGKPKDAIRIRQKYVDAIQAYVHSQQRELLERYLFLAENAGSPSDTIMLSTLKTFTMQELNNLQGESHE